MNEATDAFCTNAATLAAAASSMNTHAVTVTNSDRDPTLRVRVMANGSWLGVTKRPLTGW